ncbi:P-loop ATPase [Pseudomonas aylmerensis]|nr:P-loop ATPase [Pseudomonas aylmerensis]
MSRKGVAKFLTQYLDANNDIKVLNINAAWGSGKTFFLKNWLHEQSEVRACVYFNAWETDFTGDAFVSLVAAIREQLSQSVGKTKTAKTLIGRFTKTASKTLVAATPALAKGIIKKFTGADIALISDAIEGDAIADAAEKAVEKLIESNKDTLNVVADFKKVFNELLLEVSKKSEINGKSLPVYIFIDELDRCRPTYAIELLERIKHLFDAENCRFVIATDTSQLSHSIRAVYGSGFGSDKYLKRFFDAEFSLRSGNFDEWVKANVNIEGPIPTEGVGAFSTTVDRHERLRSGMEIVEPDAEAILAGEFELDQCQIILLSLVKTFGTKLRELEKIVRQISAVHANAKGRAFLFFWAAYLVFLKDEAPEIYTAAIYGSHVTAHNDLKLRYPGAKLYFGAGSTSVHDIFFNYLELYRGGRRAAQQAQGRSSGNALGYVNVGLYMFGESFDHLSDYPKLVELAHSID